jgi:hypothetical protein
LLENDRFDYGYHLQEGDFPNIVKDLGSKKKSNKTKQIFLQCA